MRRMLPLPVLGTLVASRSAASSRAPAASVAVPGGACPQVSWSRALPMGSSTRAVAPKVTIPTRSSGPLREMASRTQFLAPSRMSAGMLSDWSRTKTVATLLAGAGTRSPARARISSRATPRRSHNAAGHGPRGILRRLARR